MADRGSEIISKARDFMRIKKLVSSIAALAMVSSTFAGLTLTAKADSVIYSQDYESVTDASTVMTSQNAQGNVSIGTDNTNYLQYVGNSSTNSRSSYSDFSVDLSDKSAYIAEFDAALATGNKDVSQFVLRSGAIPSANSGYISNNGFIFKLEGTANSTTWTVNDVSATTVTLTRDAWYHYKLYIDRNAGLVSITITDSSGTVAADKVIAPLSGDGSKITGLYWLNGRYSNSTKIDNIVIRDVEDDDVFGEKEEETLSEVAFTQGTSKITQPAEGTTVDYTYEVSATGNYGGDLSSGATFDWSWAGLDKEDGYVNITTDANKCTVSVRNGVSNYYVPLQCTVTYGDTVLTTSYPFAIIGANSSNSSQIIPETGYPTDMNDYGDSLVGYYGTSNELTSKDVILNNWSIYGSNTSRTMQLVQDEDGTKSIGFFTNGGGGSTVANYQWSAQTSQYIMRFTAKVADGTTFGVYSNTPNNTNAVSEYAFTCSSGSLTAGTETISGVDSGKWYEFIVSVDPSVGTYTVTVNDTDGNEIGTTSEVATNTATMKYFCISGAFPVYLQSLYAYKPSLSTISVNSSADVVKVPDDGEEASTVDLSAALADNDGLKITGAVEWSLADEYANVEIASTGAQTAVLTVNPGASGEITVVATKDGKQAEKTIQLTTSSNVVAFTKSTSSITIPFTGEDTVVNEFAAETRDGSGAVIDGGSITYSLLAKDGVTETTVKGVTFENGVLSVEAGASPAVVYVKATNEDGLSTKVKVNIHGLSFAFGSQEPAEGYTQVSDTLYTEKLGYGFSDISAITVNDSNVTGTSDYRFKATVPNGNYIVTVDTTSATMTSEVVETVAATTGISKSGSSFNVAVCDGVLDLTFLADSQLSTLSISQAAAKSPLDKPKVYAIGDSTTSNSGAISGDSLGRSYCSWANSVANQTTALPDCFSGFSNNGMAGRDSVSFYNQARVETVLLNVNPGDYVTINMGINSKETNEGTSFYTLIKDYYVQGVIQRGATPIILTSTPDGPGYSNSVGTYDATTGKFSVAGSDRARNPVLRQIAQELNLNVIEVGQFGEDYFNSLTMDDVAEMNAKYGTSFESVYDMVHYWQPDHNHYIEPLASVIAEYILGEVAKIATGETPAPTATYTVTFSADNTILTTVSVKDGETVTDIPSVPEKAGYTGKWMLNGEEFTAETVINSNVTVTAEYTEIPATTYTVTFSADNASVKVDGEVVTEKTVASGSELSFTVEPADGYSIEYVSSGATNSTVDDVRLVEADENGVYTIRVYDNMSVSVSTVANNVEPIEVENFTAENGAASAQITNNQSGDVTVAIMVAVYDTYGKLISVKMGTETIEANGTKTISASNTDEGATVKAFLWNTTNNNTPLANVITSVSE
jgi:hypothetical protein